MARIIEHRGDEDGGAEAVTGALSPKAKSLILSCLIERKAQLITDMATERDEDALADLGNDISTINSVILAVQELPTKQPPPVQPEVKA